MVVEDFRDGNAAAVYRRVQVQGRALPDGLRYVASWVRTDLARCWQVMECDDLALLEQWMQQWSDLVEFEIVRVLTSTDAADAAAAALGTA
ncbi:MAG: DUF3303 family protein [Gemmatimonadota bacterium]